MKRRHLRDQPIVARRSRLPESPAPTTRPWWRWAETLGTGTMLAITTFPFVVLFPQPPAFGRGAAGIAATFLILAITGTVGRAGPVQRARIVRRVATVLAITAASVVLRIMSAGHVLTIPTPDALAWLFGLEGEDIDGAFEYEVWLEIWLACAAATLIPAALQRAFDRSPAKATPVPGPWDTVAPQAPPMPGWNGAMILLWLVGLGMLAAAVLTGHQTASFLSGCVHVTGTIADPQPHPIIRFTAHDGAVVQFTQNGWVSRELGAEVPVAYQTQDPAGTAQADTFWANWTEVLAFAWIGFGFTLAPFFGLRASFRAGRW